MSKGGHRGGVTQEGETGGAITIRCFHYNRS